MPIDLGETITRYAAVFVSPTNATASEPSIDVIFQNCAHDPLLLVAGLANISQPSPCLSGKRLRLLFGWSCMVLSQLPNMGIQASLDFHGPEFP
jgi:hypothetical protein